jgi:hypothetical protein
VGTRFCRLCGRDYVDELNPLLASLAPPPTEDVVPEQAASVEPPAAMPVAPMPVAAAQVMDAPLMDAPVMDAPITWPPPAAPVVTGPPVQAMPYELVPVPATGGLQVHLPLAELTDLVPSPAPSSEPSKPAPTDTHPVELGGPVLTAHEDEEPVVEETKAPRALDRTAVLAGALAGFVGGAVSGAAVTLFLT